ncbi:hypothetical protein BV22DRAFT_1127349 [Leucogyrophana mollusca]|uniref:Uncharacterized protein n=1 Tax=Leucogyrophana mollusca TaxID=85980 RepID=A0ACB8BPB7_9AGAM|nr:hypothetical protein BV22DRAFT_1127349 [Leucogyrophana mollusca]
MNIVRVDGRFRLKEKLGNGSYGVVYSARDVISNQEVAIKLVPSSNNPSSLECEYRVLKKLEGGVGFPRPIWPSRGNTTPNAWKQFITETIDNDNAVFDPSIPRQLPAPVITGASAGPSTSRADASEDLFSLMDAALAP